MFTFCVGDIEIEKSVFLNHGENPVVEYALRGADALGSRLELRPLIAFRDYHATRTSTRRSTVRFEPRWVWQA